MRALKICLGLFVCLVGQTLFGQSSAPQPPEIVVLHDVAYPKDAKKLLPAIIYIHGGGWRIGSQKQGPFEELARDGYFCASIEYRLTGEAKWPAQIEDCKLAVRWLRANAAKYGVDPNRIGAWGDSAGAHLVSCLATTADRKELEGTGGYPGVSSAVQVAIDYFGPSDFTAATFTDPGAVQGMEELFGVPREQNPELWKSGSPAALVKAGDPPILLVHGLCDQSVPVEQSILFDAALRKAGVPHQLVLVKNADHGFRQYASAPIDPSDPQIKALSLAFLAKYLTP
jgi:acetyl esterase/lipase